MPDRRDPDHIQHQIPHSLGVFYQALVQYLRFPHYCDEYKVMGLAPCGVPTYLHQMKRSFAC
jgi:carbamoyltransferase